MNTQSIKAEQRCAIQLVEAEQTEIQTLVRCWQEYDSSSLPLTVKALMNFLKIKHPETYQQWEKVRSGLENFAKYLRFSQEETQAFLATSDLLYLNRLTLSEIGMAQGKEAIHILHASELGFSNSLLVQFILKAVGGNENQFNGQQSISASSSIVMKTLTMLDEFFRISTNESPSRALYCMTEEAYRGLFDPRLLACFIDMHLRGPGLVFEPEDLGSLCNYVVMARRDSGYANISQALQSQIECVL